MMTITTTITVAAAAHATISSTTTTKRYEGHIFLICGQLNVPDTNPPQTWNNKRNVRNKL